MKPVRFLPLVLTLALTACGDTAPLRPATGQSLPVKPATATKTPTPDDLMAATPMAHPERVDELLKRGEVRTTDRFDLPPPDGGAAPTDPAADNSSDAVRVTEPR
jgi:hypothetical protein